MINTYSFGRIEVDGKLYTRDLMILPGGEVVPEWWRSSGHELGCEDIARIIEAGVEVLVVGTGAEGRMRVLDEVKEKLSASGIELVEKHTKEACKIFNRIYAERRTAAALHLTC